MRRLFPLIWCWGLAVLEAILIKMNIQQMNNFVYKTEKELQNIGLGCFQQIKIKYQDKDLIYFC